MQRVLVVITLDAMGDHLLIVYEVT
jgi:hypothetical protein